MGYIDQVNVGGIDSDVRDTGTRKTIAPTETTQYASKAYAKDAFFIWEYSDGKVYQCTAAVASGAQFVVGTNCKVVGDMGDAINGSVNAVATSLNEALMQEVTNRTNAVNTEKASREAADTTINARIDQIVAPSGEAPSAAEVLDARVGVDGNTFSTLGSAIRGQVGQVNSELEILTNCDIIPVTHGYKYDTASVGSTIDINNPSASSNFVCAKVPVVEGDIITISGDGGSSSSSRLYAFTDSEGVCLEIGGKSLTGLRYLKAPVDAAYIVININISDHGYFIAKGYPIPIKFADLDDVTRSIVINNLSGASDGIILTENILDGVWELGDFDSSGTPTPSETNHRTVNYIPIIPNSTYYQYPYNHNGNVVFYDYNKNIIKLEGFDRVFTAPSNAFYAKLVIYPADWGGVISMGRVAMTSPIPYNTAIYNFTNNAMYNMLEGMVSKSNLISWTDNKKADVRYPFRIEDNDGGKIARISAKEGDYIKLTFNHYVSTSYCLIGQDMGDCFGIILPASSDESILTYEYIVPYDMDLIICVQKAHFLMAEWYSSPVNKKIENIAHSFNRFNYDIESVKVVAASKAPKIRANYTQKPLTLLHLSDIHSDTNAIGGAKNFMDMFGDNIDDCIITGDLCNARYTQYPKAFSLDGFNEILLVVGNHDVYDVNGDAESHGVSYDDPAYWATGKQTYDQMLAPSISHWGVTQPANAATNGYCYYYKDYTVTNGSEIATVNTVRLIALDCMHYDETQHTWLNSVLTDAQTNGYPVVIAEHLPPMTNRTYVGEYADSAFMSKMRGMEREYGTTYLSYNGVSAPDLVDTFIDNGGEFVCWLCGHFHYAAVDVLKDHENQLFIAIETAATENTYRDAPRAKDTPSMDLMNIVSIDTYYKTIRIQRIGAEFDDFMRHRGALCINYDTKELLSSY